MKISLNDAELGALFGLPHAVICLYVMAIRPRMDYGTGMVGIRPYISWQALSEWVYIEPTAGTRHGRPSKWALMRQAQRLEAAGLVRMASNACNRQLIFECVLADRDNSVQSQAAPRPHHQAAPSKATPRAGYSREAAPPRNTQAAPHPVTGLILLPPPLAATSLSVEKPRGGVKPPSLCWSWPGKLTNPERKTALTMLKDTRDPQLLLDELQGAMRMREIKQPLRYLAKLIQLDAGGVFTAELAHLAAQQRAGQAAARRSTAVLQETKSAPLTAEQIERLPPAIRRRVKKGRAGPVEQEEGA